MSTYNVVARTSESTVVAEYKPKERKSTAYQSEADLERELIAQLHSQGYECPNLPDEAAMLQNLRSQLEKLNNYTFSDAEWQRFSADALCKNNEGIQQNPQAAGGPCAVLIRDDGSSKNISLIDKRRCTLYPADY